MSLKKDIIEALVRCVGRLGKRVSKAPHPHSIFVLRNNDIGDLLIVMPIFEALKRHFPTALITAGIGRWNFPVLANNPFVDQIMEVNAPWHNKFVCDVPWKSPRGLARSLRYLWHSEEVRKLKGECFDIGIDILGSPEGSLLMVRAGIPWRLGVKGYAGGYSACQQNVIFDGETNVGRAALRFAELLGATDLPETRPQLFLTQTEKDHAIETWNTLCRQRATKIKRILIAPGGGFVDKCWPRENYKRLIAGLTLKPNVQIVLVGSQSDYELGEYIRANSTHATNFCGKTSLRETFSLVWAADGIVCNGSMILHTAAAFEKSTIVLLGETFKSARKHKQLWGYGASDLHLGREPGRDRIFTAEETIPIVNSQFRLA